MRMRVNIMNNYKFVKQNRAAACSKAATKWLDSENGSMSIRMGKVGLLQTLWPRIHPDETQILFFNG